MDQRKMQVAYEQGNIMKHNESFLINSVTLQ